jgi:hypothetical protein
MKTIGKSSGGFLMGNNEAVMLFMFVFFAGFQIFVTNSQCHHHFIIADCCGSFERVMKMLDLDSFHSDVDVGCHKEIGQNQAEKSPHFFLSQ